MKCHQCGQDCMAGMVFCDNCGASLAALPSTPPAQAPASTPQPPTQPVHPTPPAPQPPPQQPVSSTPPAAPQSQPALAPGVCGQCGLPVPPDEALCTNCGAAMPAAPQQPGAQPQPPAPPAQPTAPSPQPPTLPIQSLADPPPLSAPTTCAQCSQPVSPGETFCTNCGAAVSAAAQQSTPPAQPPTLPVQPSPAPPQVGPQSSPPISPVQPPAPAWITCPSCQAANTPGGKFCDSCGAPLPTAGSQPPVGGVPMPSVTVPIPPVPVAGQPRLVVATTQAQIPLPLGKVEWLIGRQDPVVGVFPDVDLIPHGAEAGGVSRRHCIIRQQGDQYTIEDLGSTNYTTVNKNRLAAQSPQALNNGDEVRVGRLVLTFYTG